MRRPISILVLMLVLTGCATAPRLWTVVGGRQTLTPGNVELDVPSGWMRYNPPPDDATIMKEGLLLFITRDGAPLQLIRMNRRSVDGEFPYTKKKLSPDLLPQELAELLFDSIRSNPEITDQRMIENAPAKVNEHSGFRLSYSYQTKAGLRKRGVCYGFFAERSYYELCYEAPARYYFEKDLPTFEKLRETLRIVNKASS